MTSDLAVFMQKIMQINATTPGMGSAGPGILGITANGDETVYQLKKITVAFANECSKQQPDKKLLADFDQKIEGLLHTLQIFSVISGTTYQQLVTDLQTLTA